jgi:hypothetical protein
MSPNGRRAWREWVRRQDLRRKHKQPKGSVCRMARQARRHIPLVPGVMLPKFITARSLVGMTMGARKRAARNSVKRSGLKPYMLYEEYRIGERLRPCPGCWNCQTTWQQSSIYSQTAVMHRHGCSHDDPSGLCCFGETVPVKMECDGSGVLPARRRR